MRMIALCLLLATLTACEEDVVTEFMNTPEVIAVTKKCINDIKDNPLSGKDPEGFCKEFLRQQAEQYRTVLEGRRRIDRSRIEQANGR